MQLRKISALALYMGSYCPLSLILCAQDMNLDAMRAGFCSPQALVHGGCRSPLVHPVLSVSVVCACSVCLLATLWTLGVVKATHRVQVRDAKHIPADLINYVIPYVVSFMGLDFTSPTKLIGFVVFFFWIFWITYKSGQIIMNPMLVAFGWRLYEIKFSYLQSEANFIGRVLSRVELEPNTVYSQCTVQDVMIVPTQ